MVRNATSVTKRIMASEVAYHLAQSGLSAGVAWFDNTKNICPLKAKLQTSSISAVNGLKIALPVYQHDPLQEILLNTGTKANLEITLELSDFKPMYNFSKSASGIYYTELEKVGILRVRAIGSYDGAQKILVANKQVRVVCQVPYVVSKFTLFVQNFSSKANPNAKCFSNRLKLKKNDFNTAIRDQSYPKFGTLILDHGSDSNIENRGLVFLGAPGNRFLNLAFGKATDGEEHHLLAEPWELTGNSTLNSGFTTKFIQKGIFTGIKSDNPIFKHFDFNAPPSDPVSDKASLLRLFGTADKPSATIVLGPLYRRYLMLRYLKKISTNEHIVMPFCSQSIFDSADPLCSGTPSFDFKTDAFSNNYSNYAGYMSNIFEEAYNISADHIENSGYSGMKPPSVFDNLKKIKDLYNRDGFLYIPESNKGEIELLTDNNNTLFKGNLRRIGSGEMYLKDKRVTYSVSANLFPSFLQSNPGKIPGIVNFSGGSIVIDRPLNLREGGIISVDGDITINSAVNAVKKGAPLTLVSLGGDINIRTDSTINASLVALSGTVNKKEGMSVTINGNLVVRSLDPESLFKGGGDMKITYDQKLDPTTGGSAYGCYLSPERSYCQE